MSRGQKPQQSGDSTTPALSSPWPAWLMRIKGCRLSLGIPTGQRSRYLVVSDLCRGEDAKRGGAPRNVQFSQYCVVAALAEVLRLPDTDTYTSRF